MNLRLILCWLLVPLIQAAANPTGLIEAPARPELGFHAPYFLWVPGSVANVKEGAPTRLLVIPNNTGRPSDDPEVHEGAVLTMLDKHYRLLAEDLGVVLLCPVFPRPASHSHIYTHALDRDTFTTDEMLYRRLDLQLNAMLDHAVDLLRDADHTVARKALILGFSASGMFANRYAILHPERILAAAIGSPGGWPLAPVSTWQELAMPYPVGIADLEQIAVKRPQLRLVQSVPLFFFLGAEDDNDSVAFEDGYDAPHRELIFSRFGRTPVDRWAHAARIYADAGMNAVFRLYPETGHDMSPEMIAGVLEFFRHEMQRLDP